MQQVSITYALKWRVKFAPHIFFTRDGKAFNIKTGRQIKRCYNGRSVGYWINREWWPLDNLRQHLEIIPKKEYLPF